MRKPGWHAARIGFLLLGLGFALVPVSAQNFDVGGDFVVGFPQGEFRENVDNEGYGGSGHFGYFLGDTPIMVGAEIGFINYGTESRREPFSDTIPEVTVRVRTTNNILLLHGFARVQPRHGAVRPYAQGLFGFKYFFTRTSVVNDFDEAIASSTNFDDWTRSWGLGGGTDIRLWESGRRRRQGASDISLNVGAEYLWGGEAEYLKKGSIRQTPDGLTFLVFHSKTDMLVTHVGIRVRF